jgi:hypothetical protein
MAERRPAMRPKPGTLTSYPQRQHLPAIEHFVIATATARLCPEPANMAVQHRNQIDRPNRSESALYG